MVTVPVEMTESTFDAGVVSINYVEGPDNGPQILLVHGLGGMWQDFQNVYELIRDRWHVYAVDLRGHGKSGHTDAGYEFTDYPKDVTAFLRSVIGKPAVVWGHSLGAVTAMGVAATAPELVSAAILEDPPMMIHGSDSHRPFVERFKIIHEMMTRPAPDDEVLAFFREQGPGQAEEIYRRRLLAVRQNDPRIYGRAVTGRSRGDWDPEAVLRAITSPVLLMQADPEVGAAMEDAHADRAMAILKDAELVKFPGVGHGIHAAVTARTVQLMERFVRERVVAG